MLYREVGWHLLRFTGGVKEMEPNLGQWEWWVCFKGPAVLHRGWEMELDTSCPFSGSQYYL
jgi:hypothetical protein